MPQQHRIKVRTPPVQRAQKRKATLFCQEHGLNRADGKDPFFIKFVDQRKQSDVNNLWVYRRKVKPEALDCRQVCDRLLRSRIIQ